MLVHNAEIRMTTKSENNLHAHIKKWQAPLFSTRQYSNVQLFIFSNAHGKVYGV